MNITKNLLSKIDLGKIRIFISILIFSILVIDLFAQDKEKEELKKERENLEKEKAELKKEREIFEKEKHYYKTKEEEKPLAEEEFFKTEENIVVSASKRTQKISEAPSKVIIITSDTIRRRGYRTLVDLLQDVPYFDFRDFHDPGRFSTHMILRGITDSGQTQILVMENGIIQNDIESGWMRHVGFDYTFVDVERVEIVLGPGSALFGANAYAGLINIITKKPKQIFSNKDEKLKMEVRGMGGSYKTWMQEGSIAYRFDNGTTLQLSGRSYQSQGDFGLKRPDPGNYWQNNYEPDRVKTNEYGTVNNDRLPGNARIPIKPGFDTNKKDIFLRGKVFHKGFTLGFNLWEMKEGDASYLPGHEYFTNSPGLPFAKKNNGYFVFASYESEITNRVTSETKVYYRNINSLDSGFVYTYQYSRVDDITFGGRKVTGVPDKAKLDYGQSYLTGFQQQLNFRLTDKNQIVTGTQIERFIQSDSDSGTSLVPIHGSRQSPDSNRIRYAWENEKPFVQSVFYSTLGGVFIQDEHKFTDRYRLTVGGRYDMHTVYGKRILTSRTGFIGNPFGELKFKLLYGEAYKAPTVTQQFAELSGNEDLRPQKIKTSEIELSYLFFKTLTVKGGYFFSRLTDQIALLPNPRDGKEPYPAKLNYYQNKGASHISGVSLEADLVLYKDLSIYFNYTFTQGRDPKTPLNAITDDNGNLISITPVYEGHEIENIAARKINTGIDYLLLDKLGISLRMNYVGKRKAASSNSYFQPYDYNFQNQPGGYTYITEGKPDGYMSGYTIYHLTLTWKNLFGVENLEPQLIIRNLLNTSFAGIGRSTGDSRRPIDTVQPTISNPVGITPPYHPQPGREIFFMLSYRY